MRVRAPARGGARVLSENNEMGVIRQAVCKPRIIIHIITRALSPSLTNLNFSPFHVSSAGAATPSSRVQNLSLSLRIRLCLPPDLFTPAVSGPARGPL